MTRVKEGATGILYLSANGKSDTFVGDYDMDKARELLLEFQELKDTSGVALKNNYHDEGYNWYPSMVSYLYWYVFFPFIKYAPLIQDWFEGKADYHCENKGQFQNLLSLLTDATRHWPFEARLYYFLIKWNNRLVTRRCSTDLLFFRFALKDFRTTEIRKTLDNLKTSYLQIVPAPRTREIIQRYLRGERLYYFSQPPTMGRANRFHTSYRLDHLDPVKRKLFAVAIRVVEHSISSFIVECQDHLGALRRCKARTLYGLDDVNGYFFPILYACRTLGMKTIGHQHGAYVKRHAGYMMEGIEPKDFQWFDHVIVWGRYWKEKMLRDSKVYSPDFFIIGSNKFATTFPRQAPPAHKPKTILIPYEFLTNTARVGEYIKRFIDLGYTVAFKARPDEDLDGQLAAYCLPASYREKLRMVGKLDEGVLAEIDIVAGTMTSLMYELLPYNKIIWILDTEYRHLDDLVDEGMAHKVRYEDIASLDERYFTPTCVPKEFLFGDKSLEDTLRTCLRN